MKTTFSNMNISVKSVEVLPVLPDETDIKNINYLRNSEGTIIQSVVYVVKITIENRLSTSSLGFELFLDDYRVRKYFEFESGIYFKVYNPRFFQKHGEKKIRISLDKVSFIDTGLKFPSILPELESTLNTIDSVLSPKFSILPLAGNIKIIKDKRSGNP